MIGMLSRLAGLVLALGSSPALAHSPEAQTNWVYMAFEMKSWGAPVSSWRIGKDGSGVWVEAVKDGTPGDYALIYHDIGPGAEHYFALSRLMGKLPDPAPDSDECSNFMTDMPYGTMRLTRGATTTEISWNAGCMDDDYVAFLDLLKQADAIVSELGRASPVVNRVEAPKG